jgi:acyl CoA:acetate/3-ketoacid CoA transferase
MQPTPQKQIPLGDILEQMERIADGAERPAEDVGEMPGERIDEQVALNSEQDNKSIAQNLLQQAILLENEAEKKRAEAVRYDPTLAQKAAEAPKRGRGRPKGTTKEAIAAKTTSAEM